MFFTFSSLLSVNYRPDLPLTSSSQKNAHSSSVDQDVGSTDPNNSCDIADDNSASIFSWPPSPQLASSHLE